MLDCCPLRSLASDALSIRLAAQIPTVKLKQVERAKDRTGECSVADQDADCSRAGDFAIIILVEIRTASREPDKQWPWATARPQGLRTAAVDQCGANAASLIFLTASSTSFVDSSQLRRVVCKK